MAIRVDCSYCGRIHSLSDQYAGRKIACIACKTPIDVPDSAQPLDDPKSAPPAAPISQKPVGPPKRRQISLALEESDSWVFPVPPSEAPPQPPGGDDEAENAPQS